MAGRQQNMAVLGCKNFFSNDLGPVADRGSSAHQLQNEVREKEPEEEGIQETVSYVEGQGGGNSIIFAAMKDFKSSGRA